MSKEKTKKSKIKYIIFGIIAVLIIVFIVKSCSSTTEPDIEEDYNVAYTVSKQDMSEYINATGSIQSDAITTITSDLTGQKVTGVYVEVGDTVTKGQKIATVDVAELKNDLADMKKAYNKEQKQLKEAYDEAVANTDDKEDALEDLNAAIDLAKVCTNDPDNELCVDFDNKAVSKLEKAYKAAEKAYNASVSQAKEALESTSEYTAKIKELQKQVNGATITSPCDGTVISLSVNKGSLIAEGMIASIQESEDYKVTVNISESQILKVKTGMRVSLTVVATGDRVYKGTVTKVVKIAGSTESGDVGYSAVITIDDKNTDLLIGMTAKCKIILKEANSSLAIPYDTVFEDNDGENYVYKLEQSGDKYKVTYAYVTVGTKGSYYYEISDGLAEGDLVLSSSLSYDNGDTISADKINFITTGDENV